MKIVYLQQALNDLEFWKASGNKAIQLKITRLIESIEHKPFEGIGKPEPLKYHHSGKWSRRNTGEHRIVYEIEDDKVFILSMYGHYR